jgi:uncharacterized membrane protein YdbT with pleckstrin-like domain
MANNPHPIQIKKRILFNLIYGFVWLIAIFLIVAIFSLTIAIYTALAIFVLIILGMLWNLLYLNSIEYALDNKNFTFKGGVISRFEKVLPYSKIQHVIIYESFWQRVLGLSSVSIETARESGFAPNTSYGQQNAVQVRTGPFIPDLNTEEAEKLKSYIISVSNTKYKPVAGI